MLPAVNIEGTWLLTPHPYSNAYNIDKAMIIVSVQCRCVHIMCMINDVECDRRKYNHYLFPHIAFYSSSFLLLEKRSS